MRKADMYLTFYRLSRQIGLRGPSASHGPRLHDMRHNSGTRIIPATAEQCGHSLADHVIVDA
jgi:integrase/recombinase XerD